MITFAFMSQKRYYKVAGEIFSLELPESQILWDALAEQYTPFEVAEPSEKPMFELSFTTDPFEAPKQCVYDEPTEDGETVVKLYRSGSDWLMDVAIDHRCPVCASIKANEDFSRASIYLYDRKVSNAQFGINNGTMLMFAFAGATRNILEMHASVIEKAGKAYLFLGKSGTGKSTHSRLWLENIEGTTLMNDDNPVVKALEDGTIMCYGSPWSGKTRCYKNICAPIGAYVQIRQCPENRIEKMSVISAFSSLFSSVSGMKDDDSAMADGINDTMNKVLSKIPFYLLDCRIDPEAAHLCARTVGAE